MQKLVFINGTGTQIDLTSGNFGITNWSGLSNTGLNIQTQQVPFEDGGVFLDALMEQREIEVTVAIYDGNNLELRYQKKRELISALNPKLGEGTLIYTNDYLSRQIKAVPQIPLFENKNSNDAGTLKASVAFSCCSPYWEDVEETEIEIDSTTVTDIINNGDVDIGIKVELKPLMTNVENPFIFNITQNKKIEYNKQLTENPLIINTNMGKKDVYKNMLNRDEMKYADVGHLEQDIVYSDFYRKYFCITNGTIKSSVDGEGWTTVMTTDYDKFYIYSNIVILYGETNKLKMSLNFVDFTEFEITINCEPYHLVCFQPDVNVQHYYIFMSDNFNICFTTFTIDDNTVLFSRTTFTEKNLPITGNTILLIFNTKLRTLYAISGYNCYRFNQNEWVLSSENLYPYLPNGKYIRENNLMVCYGTQYGFICWSYDGIHWERSEYSSFNDILDITYDTEKHKYLAVGQYQDYWAIQRVLIAESSDLVHWELINGLEDLQHSVINQILTKGNGIYLMNINWEGYNYNIAISNLNTYQNEISNLTTDSDLSLSLLKGTNRIMISDKTICKVSYRQKYIGV